MALLAGGTFVCAPSQTDIHTEKQTDTQPDRHTDRKTQTDTQRHAQTKAKHPIKIQPGNNTVNICTLNDWSGRTEGQCCDSYT